MRLLSTQVLKVFVQSLVAQTKANRRTTLDKMKSYAMCSVCGQFW